MYKLIIGEDFKSLYLKDQNETIMSYENMQSNKEVCSALAHIHEFLHKMQAEKVETQEGIIPMSVMCFMLSFTIMKFSKDDTKYEPCEKEENDNYDPDFFHKNQQVIDGEY